MKMKTKAGKEIVYLYDGVIPKSGKALVEFAGHKLVHRSIGKDKSDLLVHMETRIIIRAYPKGTDRSVILNDLAENIERLDYFLDNREEFELQERPKLLKIKDDDSDMVYTTFEEPSYSRSGSYAHLNKDHVTDTDVGDIKFKQEFMLPLKKSYDVGASKW